MLKRKILIVSLCMLLGILVSIIASNRIRTKNEYDLYMEFLNGNREINGMKITDIIIPTGEPEKQYFSEYTFWDSDDDNFNELHIRSERCYYIIDCVNNDLYVWKSLHPRTELLNNGDYLYVHTGEAPLHYDYKYFITNQEGEDIYSTSYSWYDENNNGEYDENDLYFTEDREVLTYEEWEKVQKLYLSIGTDKISWIKLTDHILDVQHTTAEAFSTLTIQEALDIVFDYAVSEEEQQMIFDFEQRGQEKDGGRLRYVWHEEINPEHDRVISEQGYVITSDNTVYRSYLYALGLRDTGGHYTRTEWVNYYWVNMQTGDVIEQRWFDEDICQWQSTQEYERYICEEEPWIIKSPDEMEDISLGAALTTQEVLDELYNCLSENKNSVCDLRPFELWDGRIGYEWYETDKPYYVFRLENTGFTGIPEEKCYAIFEFSVQIYCEDYNAQVEADELYKYYEGEQRMQFYAVDMQTGEIIESREEGTREYTQEYREKVLECLQFFM